MIKHIVEFSKADDEQEYFVRVLAYALTPDEFRDGRIELDT